MNRVEKFKLLYRDFEQDPSRAKTKERINHYVDLLEDFKEKNLENVEWAEDLDGIDLVEDGYIHGATIKDFREAEREVKNQFDKILYGFHLDRNEVLLARKDSDAATSMPTINLNLSQNQNQSTILNVKLEIEKQVRELNEELGKKRPDKGKVQRIVEKLLSLGTDPDIVKLVMRAISFLAGSH